MPERFLSAEQAADILGISPRRVHDMMASGEIRAWCSNPKAKRKRYMTTERALGLWQEASMLMPSRKRVQDWHIPRK